MNVKFTLRSIVNRNELKKMDEKGQKIDLFILTQRLLEEKAILVDTIKSYVINQRIKEREEKNKRNEEIEAKRNSQSYTEKLNNKKLEKKNQINDKAMKICKRLVQEKNLLVSHVGQLANKLKLQQQNYIKLQTNAKNKIFELREEVKQLKKEKNKSAEMHRKMSSELGKSRALARHLRRAVVQYHSNKNTPQAEDQLKTKKDAVYDNIDAIDNNNNNDDDDDDEIGKSDDDTMENFPSSVSSSSSLTLPIPKISQKNHPSMSKVLSDNKIEKEKHIMIEEHNANTTNINHTNSITNYNSDNDNNDNGGKTTTVIKNSIEESVVTHTIDVSDHLIVKQEDIRTSKDNEDDEEEDDDDDIPPPPPITTNNIINLATQLPMAPQQKISLNSKRGKNNGIEEEDQTIAVAQIVENHNGNNETHVIAKQLSNYDNSTLKNEKSPPIAKIISTSVMDGVRDGDLEFSNRQRRKSSSVQSGLQNNAKVSIEQNCIQHVLDGELLTKYASSSSVRSMIRQGISNGATEKWVIVNTADDGNLMWGNAKARFTKKMSKFLKLDLITGVYATVPSKKSTASMQRTDWHHSFTVETNSRTYMFVCPSILSAATWIYGLQKMLNKINNCPTSNNKNCRVYKSRGQVLIHLLKIYLDTKAMKMDVTRESLIIDALNMTVLDKLSGMLAGRNSSSNYNNNIFGNDEMDDNSRLNAILNLPSVPTFD